MKLRILSVLLAILLFLSGCQISDSSPEVAVSHEALFHFIDVGQGDSIFIDSGDANVLIDAGTSEGGTAVYDYLKSIGIEYIDILILTHPHDDHIGGSARIINSFDIGQVFINGDSSNSYAYENMLDALIEKEITPEVPNLESAYKKGSLRIKFLSPSHLYESTNDNSLVVSVQYGETKALFMADAEKNVEEELLKAEDIKADILKIGHHGSRNASTDKFLREVLPSVCVIQCGKDNSYGHPHKEAVARLEKISTRILRTDELGTIVLRSDGKTVTDEENNEIAKISAEDIADSIYIGNKKSKVYHTDTCPNLPSEKNMVTFDTLEDAQNSGYKPCGNCI